MKKRIVAVLLLWFAAAAVFADDFLETAIRKKDWPGLAARFGDDSHLLLAAYFQECQDAGFTAISPDALMFFARFRDFGEIGEIAFEQEGGAYRRMKLKRTVKRLYFVRTFARYAVTDRRLRLGDAEIHFKKGFLYRGVPMGHLFLFAGEWEFRIRPDDEEERLTLIRLEGKNTFVKEAQAGLFVISHPDDLLAGLPSPEESDAPADAEAGELYRLFQERWGLPVSFFDGVWYFPFAGDFNAALFQRKTGKSHFRYIFNSANAPDTSLVSLPENKFYLNYNAVKGLKFTQSDVEEMDLLRLNLFLTPQTGFLSATSVMEFKEPAGVKMVRLDPGLVVNDFGRSRQNELQMFRHGDTCYLMGDEVKKFSFYYSGGIDFSGKGGDMAMTILRERSKKNVDQYYVLDRDQNFYPNPGPHFFRSQVKISLPASLSCLATGRLLSRRKLGDRDEFIFASPGGKGVSLICGAFEKLVAIPGSLPVRVFGKPKLKLRESYSAEAIRGYVDFLVEKFGPLEIPELNILFRRGEDYGGWSHQGFVVFNLMDTVIMDSDVSVMRRLRADSPVVFEEVNRDTLVHELAHQWWGGVVSWRSYQDQWLTEGLAQFATLLYLQDNLSDRRFRRIVAGAKRWVFRHNDSGPILYGKRIGNLAEDLQTFQSIVYNKAALVFLMLREMLGEEEVLKRLRQVLVDFKYQNVASGRFIQHVSHGDHRLQKFFNGWVHSRKLPRVHSRVTLNGNNAEIALTQENTDFVFPLSVRVATREGEYTRTLIVEEKEQKFKITENAPILSIEVEASVSPVELEG